MRARMNFYFTEAMRSLSTNKATSFAAIVAMVVALLIVGVTAAFFIKAHAEGTRLSQDAGMVHVYLKSTASENDVSALQATLNQNPNVQKVTFVSKDDALRKAKKLFKDSPGVIQNLSTNPFPASLDAKLKDPTKMQSVAATMKGQPGVDEVRTGGERSEKFINMMQVISLVLFLVGLGILVAATVMVANTIRLSIYSRRREIEVMKLVGASNGFVRMPFMIEGFLCGVFAAFLATALVFTTVKVVGTQLNGVFSHNALGAPRHDVPLGTIALGLLVLGILLGMFGSASSMRKYLKT